MPFFNILQAMSYISNLYHTQRFPEALTVFALLSSYSFRMVCLMQEFSTNEIQELRAYLINFICEIAIALKTELLPELDAHAGGFSWTYPGPSIS